MRSVSQEQAVADAVGKQIAGTPFKRSVFSSGLPFLRIPWGPSLREKDLIPFLAYLKNINFRFFKLVIEQFVLIEPQYDEVLNMISNVNNAYYQKKLEEAK